MSKKQDNEITLKIKGNLDEFYSDIENKEFKIVHEFSMDDTYFVPKILNLKEISTREILSKAVLLRKIIGKTSGKVSQKITFKIKEFDTDGNILNQDSINCEVLDIQSAKKLLKAIGYKEIMNIQEDDRVYENAGFRFAVKDIRNGDNLIEAEIGENQDVDTVEELVEKVANFKIPVYLDNYFVKKAEVELDKVLGRK